MSFWQKRRYSPLMPFLATDAVRPSDLLNFVRSGLPPCRACRRPGNARSSVHQKQSRDRRLVRRRSVFIRRQRGAKSEEILRANILKMKGESYSVERFS